jgi:hypothetical protein
MIVRSGTGMTPGNTRLALRGRLACVPVRERCFLLFVLGCAALPAASMAANDAGNWANSLQMVGLALTLSAGATLMLEKPRSGSPAAYLKQLRQRLERAQNDYDVALRRRLEEEHRESETAVEK